MSADVDDGGADDPEVIAPRRKSERVEYLARLMGCTWQYGVELQYKDLTLVVDGSSDGETVRVFGSTGVVEVINVRAFRTASALDKYLNVLNAMEAAE